MTVFDILTLVGTRGGGFVAQLCTDIKEHSSQGVDKHCHIVSPHCLCKNFKVLLVLVLFFLLNKPFVGLEQPEVSHKHFTLFGCRVFVHFSFLF